jgi:TonB family protein
MLNVLSNMKKMVYTLILLLCFRFYGFSEEKADSTADTLAIELDDSDIVLTDEDDTSDIVLSDDDIELTDEEEEDSLPPIEKMPEFVKQVDIEYPPEVYKNGIEGKVLVNIIINDSGTVDSVAIAQGLHPVLDSNVVQAARQFVFTPAIAGGKPVPVLIQYERIFTLNEVVEKVEKYVNFSGRVIEKGTKNPIADAMIVLHFQDTVDNKYLDVPFHVYLERIGKFEGQYIEENRLVALTDSLGEFKFYSLPPGRVEVRTPLPGYEEFVETENINPDEELNVKYFVRRISYSDYEIVVYGKTEKKEVSRRKLTLNEVKKIPGFGGDAVKVVQALPGVARPTFGMSQIIVRGANTRDSKFFLDGVEIPLLFHYGLKSTYNSDALQSVDFYPGGFGTRYGGAVAGIIEITGRKPKNDRWHGYGDANFFDGSIFTEGPIGKKVSILATARRSFIGDIIKLAAEKSPSNTVLTIAPTYWDYIVRTDVDITGNQHAYLTLFGVKNKMEMISSDVRGGSDDIDAAKDAFKVELLFHMGIASWNWNISDILKNDLKYALTYGESNISAFGFFKSTNDYVMHSIRNQMTYAPSKKLQLNLGADIQLFPLNLILQLPAGENQIMKDTTNDWLFGVVGGYLNVEWKPVENVQIIPGIRYDYYPELNYNGANYPEFWDYKNVDNETRFSGEPSFRLNGRYEFVKNHTAKGALGNYNQSPEPMGQTVHKTWGDPELPVTRASQYVIGYEWQITDLIHAEIEGYYNRQWDVPRGPTKEELINGSELFLADGKKRMKGLELMLRHDQGERFFGWVAYSLSRSEYYNYDLKKYVLFGKDQTHNLIAVGNWKLPKNWEVGFKLQYTTGDPETPLIGEIYNEKYHFFEQIYGEINSARLDPTFQLDLRFDKKIIFKKWMASVYVDFFNIGYFLYKSPQTYMYNPGDPYNPKLQQPNRRAANQYSIPSIGLKVEF